MKMTVRATDVKNNFGKYLQHAAKHGEVIIEKNGRPVAKLVALNHAEAPAQKRERVFACDQLLGILRGAEVTDYKAARQEALEKKYGCSD